MSLLKRLKKKYLLHIAVKEALDSLPTAVCYFTPGGSVKLCNTAMYTLYRRLAQSDLQTLAELQEALDGCGSATGVVRDGNVFLFPDGGARLFSRKEIRTSDGRVYTEVTFSDVTELYEKRRELERQSKELKAMYRELRVLSDNIAEATREQEILNLKSRLHDQMNLGVAAIRQILRQDTASEENAAAVAQFRRAIRVLQEENANPQDDLSELLRDAEVSGIRIDLTGSLPEEKAQAQLLLAVLREACVNAARHADARTLYASVSRTETGVTLCVSNDGKPPAGQITPRGGLADLRRSIEKAGGSMTLRSLPTFLLTVTLPNTETEERK